MKDDLKTRSSLETWDRSTRLVHAGAEANETSAITVPIYQSSTFVFDSAEHGADLCQAVHPSHLYTRWGNPTTQALELALADVEGAEAALAFSSGMAAGVTAVMPMVKSGDHIVAANCLYAGMTELFERVLPPLGVETTFVDPAEDGAFERALSPQTVLIYVETPANPTLAITDLEAVAELARSRGVFTLADNTWASPWNVRPLELGIDAVIHSATKYLGGHSDVIAGAAAGSREWIDRVWPYLKIFGGCPSPHDAWLLHRGIKTLGLRVERQNASALELARFLSSHPRVLKTHYPGLPDHPGHDVARRQMRGFGGMLAFEVESLDAGRALLEALRLVTHAVSLGGVETLAVHPASTTHAPLTPEERRRADVSDGLIRVSVGLEAADDLIADFEQALATG
ncbi:MAG: aminotransferase class I/II-fold pyridoxal phosphate-dependent enzyme [bacterium]|nr:aminotransferase class I/II-fold pyridoxal phosphate-dependent enzyme [bacterium]